MAVEVELKAWADDPGRLEKLLRELFTFEGAFRKEDTYFRNPGKSGRRDTFRLRIENGAAAVTWKEKDVRDGIEVNREHEFTISEAAVFRDFILHLGCVPSYGKVKEGLRFRSGSILLELVTVKGLGTFLEIEKLLETGEEAGVARAETEIRELLSRLGIDESRLEPRFYSDLLAGGGKDRGNS